MSTTTEKAPKAKAPKAERKPRVSRVPANETGADRFRRVALPRLRKTVKALGQLQNVAKGAGYEFTAEQANVLMEHVDTAVDALRQELVNRVNGRGKAVDAITL